MKTKIQAYAKINPYLDITSRRRDGYHDIESYMQTISLADTLTLELTESGITVSGSVADKPERDLTYRAALAFFEFTPISDVGVHITLEKRIPVFAGLGGGSADAAAVIRGLNQLLGTGLEPERLAVIAESVGSDVPFLVYGGSRIVSGRGEVVRDAPEFPDCRIVVVEGSRGADTAAQYRLLDSKYGDFSERNSNIGKFTDAVSSGDLEKTAALVYNIFEDTDAYDPAIVNKLKEEGALNALLSGSGSAVFGIFRDDSAADRAATLMHGLGYNAIPCRPIRKY